MKALHPIVNVLVMLLVLPVAMIADAIKARAMGCQS